MAYKFRHHWRKGTTYTLAGNTPIPLNKAIPGLWNFIDDRTGFKCKSSQKYYTWDGFLTDDAVIEPRTPQDFVRAVRDQKPLPPQMVRVQTEPQFGSETEDGLINELLLRK